MGPMSEKPPAAVAVIVRDRRVLVIKRHIPDGSLVWQFPGGKIEQGETPAEAAVREAWEEVGLPVTATRTLGQRNHPQTGRRIHYIACAARSAWVNPDPREVEDFGWFGLEELAERTPEGVWEPVQAYLDEILAP